MIKKILCVLLLVLSRGFVGAMTKPSKIEWGFSDRQGDRETMEDAFFHEMIEISPGTTYPCFGLFDGHGGPHASKHVAAHFPSLFETYVKNEIPATGTPGMLDEVFKEGLKQCCVLVDQALQLKYSKQGTTALIGLVVDKSVYLAWVGDSRGLIFSHVSPKQEPILKMATVDHKPDSPLELERIGVKMLLVPKLLNILTVARLSYIGLCITLRHLSQDKSF